MVCAPVLLVSSPFLTPLFTVISGEGYLIAKIDVVDVDFGTGDVAVIIAPVPDSVSYAVSINSKNNCD